MGMQEGEEGRGGERKRTTEQGRGYQDVLARQRGWRGAGRGGAIAAQASTPAASAGHRLTIPNTRHGAEVTVAIVTKAVAVDTAVGPCKHHDSSPSQRELTSGLHSEKD